MMLMWKGKGGERGGRKGERKREYSSPANQESSHEEGGDVDLLFGDAGMLRPSSRFQPIFSFRLKDVLSNVDA